MMACPCCGQPNCKQCARERAMEEFWGVPEDHLDDDTSQKKAKEAGDS